MTVDRKTQRKWDRAAPSFDFMNGRGAELRWAPVKRELFSHMRGKILFLAVGTGLDIQFFPPDLEIVGIDISPKMLGFAERRAAAYPGKMELRLMDVHDMSFETDRFDQIYTSCTFCSVPNPVAGLRALHHVLVPGGELRMFEHTGSRVFPFDVMMHFMTLLSQFVGPSMNRPTVENVRRAGFEILGVNNVYLDVVKTITARKKVAREPESGFATPANGSASDLR